MFSEALRILDENTAHYMIEEMQQALGERLGVAKSVVSYYESGDRFPSYDVLIKIAHCFHVTTDYLLDLDKVKTLDVSDLNDRQIGVLSEMIDLLREQGK